MQKKRAHEEPFFCLLKAVQKRDEETKVGVADARTSPFIFSSSPRHREKFNSIT
jgi:hypothetical protein